MKTKIALFRGKKIRKTIFNNEWWFSVIDIIEVLVGTDRPRKYWSDLKKKLKNEGYDELSDKIGQLKLLSSDGKKYLSDCANTETMFRIIQSIPSPKVEPLKRWLAKVGYERVKEIEDPELATKPFIVIVSNIFDVANFFSLVIASEAKQSISNIVIAKPFMGAGI